MYKIKQIPEDFYVKELINLDINSGKYAYFLLKKRNLTTLGSLELISEKSRINLKNFGYAGNKDKNAITDQFISVLHGHKNLENLKIRNIELRFIGYGRERINLGRNIGNEFMIVVRNLNKKHNRINFIVNYFDEQRFSKNNVLIGRLLIKRNFKEACKLLNLDVNNPINSLNNLNKKSLRFYIHSYQSYIFNEVVSEYLKERYKTYKKIKYSLGNFIFVNKKEKLSFPLISFDTKFKKKDNIYLKILKKEGIHLKDFLIKQLPFLIEETIYRDVLVDVKNFKTLNYEKDELNSNKFKQMIKFSLPKGSYATILIKQMFEH
ncbi:MAG: tRNA pseudouridine(13) synthase TruD [Nanoarchaeota archaeon]